MKSFIEKHRRLFQALGPVVAVAIIVSLFSIPVALVFVGLVALLLVAIGEVTGWRFDRLAQ